MNPASESHQYQGSPTPRNTSSPLGRHQHKKKPPIAGEFSAPVIPGSLSLASAFRRSPSPAGLSSRSSSPREAMGGRIVPQPPRGGHSLDDDNFSMASRRDSVTDMSDFDDAYDLDRAYDPRSPRLQPFSPSPSVSSLSTHPRGELMPSMFAMHVESLKQGLGHAPELKGGGRLIVPKLDMSEMETTGQLKIDIDSLIKNVRKSFADSPERRAAVAALKQLDQSAKAGLTDIQTVLRSLRKNPIAASINNTIKVLTSIINWDHGVPPVTIDVFKDLVDIIGGNTKNGDIVSLLGLVYEHASEDLQEVIMDSLVSGHLIGNRAMLSLYEDDGDTTFFLKDLHEKWAALPPMLSYGLCQKWILTNVIGNEVTTPGKPFDVGNGFTARSLQAYMFDKERGLQELAEEVKFLKDFPLSEELHGSHGESRMHITAVGAYLISILNTIEAMPDAIALSSQIKDLLHDALGRDYDQATDGEAPARYANIIFAENNEDFDETVPSGPGNRSVITPKIKNTAKFIDHLSKYGGKAVQEVTTLFNKVQLLDARHLPYLATAFIEDRMAFRAADEKEQLVAETESMEQEGADASSLPSPRMTSDADVERLRQVLMTPHHTEPEDNHSEIGLLSESDDEPQGGQVGVSPTPLSQQQILRPRSDLFLSPESSSTSATSALQALAQAKQQRLGASFLPPTQLRRPFGAGSTFSPQTGEASTPPPHHATPHPLSQQFEEVPLAHSPFSDDPHAAAPGMVSQLHHSLSSLLRPAEQQRPSFSPPPPSPSGLSFSPPPKSAASDRTDALLAQQRILLQEKHALLDQFGEGHDETASQQSRSDGDSLSSDLNSSFSSSSSRTSRSTTSSVASSRVSLNAHIPRVLSTDYEDLVDNLRKWAHTGTDALNTALKKYGLEAWIEDENKGTGVYIKSKSKHDQSAMYRLANLINGEREHIDDRPHDFDLINLNHAKNGTQVEYEWGDEGSHWHRDEFSLHGRTLRGICADWADALERGLPAEEEPSDEGSVVGAVATGPRLRSHYKIEGAGEEEEFADEEDVGEEDEAFQPGEQALGRPPLGSASLASMLDGGSQLRTESGHRQGALPKSTFEHSTKRTVFGAAPAHYSQFEGEGDMPAAPPPTPRSGGEDMTDDGESQDEGNPAWLTSELQRDEELVQRFQAEAAKQEQRTKERRAASSRPLTSLLQGSPVHNAPLPHSPGSLPLSSLGSSSVRHHSLEELSGGTPMHHRRSSQHHRPGAEGEEEDE